MKCCCNNPKHHRSNPQDINESPCSIRPEIISQNQITGETIYKDYCNWCLVGCVKRREG